MPLEFQWRGPLEFPWPIRKPMGHGNSNGIGPLEIQGGKCVPFSVYYLVFKIKGVRFSVHNLVCMI